MPPVKMIGSADGLEVRRAVLAQGADQVVGQGFSLIDPAADLADKTLLACGIRCGLDVALVIGVGHGLLVGDHPCFGHRANEHSVGAQVHIAFHLQAHKGVDMPREEAQTVIGPELVDPLKFIRAAAALEAKILEHAKRRGHIQAVDVHDAGLLDNVMGVVLLVDTHGNPVGAAGHLRNGVDDQAVVL